MKTPQTAGLTKYVHHAQRFGTESVMQTAAQQGLSYELLIQLQTQLDAIDAKARKRGQRQGKRLNAEVRVRRLLGLPDSKEEEADAK